jgi:hypothetical protein
MNPTTGERCNFFRWLPGSRTPSVSPRLGSTSQLPAFTQPSGPGPLPFVLFPGTGGQQNLSSMPSAAPRKATCLMVGCNSTRIRKGCGRRMCKAHCRETPAGDCADPAHKMGQATATSFMAAAAPSTTSMPIFPAPTYPTAAFPNASFTPASAIDPDLLQHQVQIAPPPFASLSRVPVHAHTEPVFTSHISQVFTSQMAREEQMRETSRQREATRLESKQKAHQTVFVYAWMEVRS